MGSDMTDDVISENRDIRGGLLEFERTKNL